MRARLPVPAWYQDLCSCLHVDAACVLSFFGHEPLAVLGSGWGFQFRPGDWEPVEFFCPAPDGDLGRALAPHHRLRCRWHHPDGPDAARAALVEALAAGLPPIVAVDNYHLPFRPAYHDVHAGHLVVVHGVDTDRGTVDVLDPMPPAFQGTLPAAVLEASRASGNPDDGSDPFFAGRGLDRRWLELRPAGGPRPLTSGWVDEVLERNREGLLRGDGDPGCGAGGDGVLRGLAGLEAYLAALPRRAAEEGGRVLREVYVLGWPVQAATSLHGEFLALAGDRLDRPELREAGRWVELVAHRWTALRMAAAHGVGRPAAAARELVGPARRLLLSWREALERVDHAAARPAAT